MLDKFLEVSYRSSTEKTASRQLVDKLKEFPLEELQKLASGDETCKLAYGMEACGPGGSDNTWLGKYTGTPLFSKAVELEKALLQLDMEDQQMREQERAQRPQPSDTWAKRDAIQLQKRMLDLDLVMAQNGGADEPAASPEAKEEKAIAELEGAQQEEAVAGGGEDAAHEATENEAIKMLEQAHAGGGEGAPTQPPKAKPKAPPKEEEAQPAAAKVAAIISAGRFLAKTAKPLTMHAREEIKPKNFADPKGNGPGDTGKYPIEDKKHAKSALGLVGMHGSDAEKSKVRAAVAKKFPGLEKDAAGDAGEIIDALTRGGHQLSGLAGGVGGGVKAHGADVGATGTAVGAGRGSLGAWLGATVGRGLGEHVGSIVARTLGPMGLRPGVMGAVQPATAALGTLGGGVLGYKALTSGYKKKEPKHKHEDEKTAGLLGTALSAGKAAIPAIGGALSAGKNLATSAYKSGGLGQVASSFGNVAKNFAQKNPLAAAGVAGAGGMVAGKMLSNSQPRQ